MSISRPLRIALFVSLLWHLFWMFSVSIVFLPSGLELRRYPSVSFLGSILSSPLPLFQQRELPEFPTEAEIEGLSVFDARPQASLPAEKGIFNPDAFIDVDVSAKKSFSVGSFASSEKSLGQREVIFQPPMPQYPEWAGSQQFRRSSFIFNIYISADGLVQEITNVHGSGNPEIEAALARYIRKWRFAPAVGPLGQWQTVEINPDLK